MSEQAVQSLEKALRARVKFYNSLDDVGLLQAAIGLVEESAVDFERSEMIRTVLPRVAALGSIDAVAIMVVMGCSQEHVAAALLGITERSEDIKEGLLVAGLTVIFEEWAEKEIAAGRMTKAICPKTGKTLYSSVEKKKRA